MVSRCNNEWVNVRFFLTDLAAHHPASNWSSPAWKVLYFVGRKTWTDIHGSKQLGEKSTETFFESGNGWRFLKSSIGESMFHQTPLHPSIAAWSLHLSDHIGSDFASTSPRIKSRSSNFFQACFQTTIRFLSSKLKYIVTIWLYGLLNVSVNTYTVPNLSNSFGIYGFPTP